MLLGLEIVLSPQSQGQVILQLLIDNSNEHGTYPFLGPNWGRIEYLLLRAITFWSDTTLGLHTSLIGVHIDRGWVT